MSETEIASLPQDVSSTGSSMTSLHRGANGTLSMPAWNHRTIMYRRRRELQALGVDLDDDEFAAWHGRNRPRRRATEERRQAEEGDGGKTNPQKHQQVGALFQGYGTHYLDLWVGTPPQRQTVIVDTGSGVTAFPCESCIDCGESYHTDHYFNPGASETFERLACGSCYRGRCSPGGAMAGAGGGHICRINMMYQEGSSWTAYEAVDVSYAGGPHDLPLRQGPSSNEEEDKSASLATSPPATTREEEAEGLNPNDANRFAFRLAFGCQFSLTGLFKTQLADGIMGMDNAGKSFWKQMYDAKAIDQQQFSLCFSRQDYAERKGTRAGAVTLGGVDTNFHLTPLVWTKNIRSLGFFTVRLKSIYLRENGGESFRSDNKNSPQTIHKIDISQASLNTGGVIVDSGTTDTYMTQNLARPFQLIFEKITGGALIHDPVALTEDQLLSLPTILMVLEGTEDNIPLVGASETAALTENAGLKETFNEAPEDVVVAIPATHYMEYDADAKLYTARFYLEETGGSVLGANTMQGHDVVFDLSKAAIGWAESPCDYLALVNGEDQAYDLRYSHGKGGESGTESSLDDGMLCQSGACRFGIAVTIIAVITFAVMTWRALRGYASKKQYDSALPSELDFEEDIGDDDVMTMGQDKSKTVIEVTAKPRTPVNEDDGEVSLTLRNIS